MQKIKMLAEVPDNLTGEMYAIGRVLDLGADRNKSAVDRGLAEWVSEPKQTEKKEAKPQTRKAEK